MTAALDLDALADVLRRTRELAALDVALGIAAAGVPVLATVPGGKDPMLTRRHIDGIDTDAAGNDVVIAAACEMCRVAGLRPVKDHGATLDPATIRRYWGAHPDAGVGMKAHPQLVRGDADFADAAELKRSYGLLRYGVPHGEPLPFEASTPGGRYRRRLIHALPEGVPSPGGGSAMLGVSWYGVAGYIVVKGRHPNGTDYPPFFGTITPLPEAVCAALRRSGGDGGGDGAAAASPADTAAFLARYDGRGRLGLLDGHRAALAAARAGERHHLAAAHLVIGFREAVAGLVPAQMVVDAVHGGLRAAGWDEGRFSGEWAALVRWAVGQVAGLTPEQATADIADRRDRFIVAQLERDFPAALLDHWEAQVGRDLTDDELDELEALHNPRRPPAGVDPFTGEIVAPMSPVNLPDSFWQARPVHQHIRAAAHARGRSADAVLACVLVRVALLIPPAWKLPPIVGAVATVDVIFSVVGRSGAGKTSANKIAEELTPIRNERIITDLGLGSGEGVVAAYLGPVEDVVLDGKKVKTRRQVIDAVSFVVDEAQLLAEMSNRKGTTILPTLRQAWSGNLNGQANAGDDTRRRLAPGAARFAALICAQPEHAVPIVDDHAGGTPQRITWLSSTDPTIPAPGDRPAWPGPLDITPPAFDRTYPMERTFTVADEVADDIRRRDHARNTGSDPGDSLDGHAELARLKVAALLAVLDGRTDIGVDDWDLAGMVQATSTAVRSMVVATKQLQQRDREHADTARAVRREAAIENSGHSRALTRAAKAIGNKAHREPGVRLLRSKLGHAVASRDKQFVALDDAIAEAERCGWIVPDGDGWRAGEARPA